MKYALLALLIIGATMTLPHLFSEWRTDRALQEQIDASVGQMSADRHVARNRRGFVRVEGVAQPFTESFVRQYIKKSGKSSNAMWVWRWGGVAKAAATAMGIDRNHHFSNSYLVGYQPFETDQIWVPLYTLAMRKHYQYDHLQYTGLKEVWQNSKQAYFYTRGDCEDHAIILADWLIEMGVNARVVLGRHRKGGHAWVVFFKGGEAYLLEATDKRKTRSIGAIPKASTMIHYHPEYQFNRDSFWVNTGPPFTTRYSGPQWKVTSRFVEVANQQ